MQIFRQVFVWLLLVYTLPVWGQLPDSALKLPFPSNPTGAGLGPTCGTDLLLNTLRQSAAFRKAEEKMNSEVLSAVRVLNNDPVVLPVVFHILADDPYAIPDQILIEGLAELNDIFAKRGLWSGGKGIDTKIQFCLARKDPEGGNTTGITRVPIHWGNHVNPQIEDSKVKANAQWDPSRYINIWYVKSIDAESIAEFICGQWTRAGVGGYATLPPGSGPADGIVIASFGLLLAHEMGHFLGLYHTFEGYCTNNNCTTNGDRVCDTPPDGSYRSSPSCTNPDNSCNTDTLSNYSNGFFTSDVPDPIDNIMDYNNVPCQNAFTQGQADRMHGVINTQRKGLLELKCDVPCTDNVYAIFRRNISSPKAGDEVEFTNSSVGATTYQWFVDGVQVATTQNYKHTFNQTGRYKITLRATKSSTCYSSHSEYVIVNCGVSARFYLDKQAIASTEVLFPDSIKFTNNSLGANDFKWLVSNDKGMAEQLVTTQRDLIFMFTNPALYSIRLIASNGSCIDTTFLHKVNVQDPTVDGALYMNAVHCYEQTKIKLDFYICNHSFDTLSAGTPISFYDADPRQAGAKKVGATFYTPAPVLGGCCSWMSTHFVEVGAPGLNQLFAVLNDSGTTLPLTFPATSVVERTYANNIQVTRNFQFKVVPNPATAIMAPGDTIQITSTAAPTAVSSYVWSSSDKLSCTNCRTTTFISDTTRAVTKMVKATSTFGCYDSAYVKITVPPYHDFRIQIDEAECAGTDSIQVKFTLYNDFKRPLLPKGLTVRFYDANPLSAGAKQLEPSFILADTIIGKSFSFTTTIFKKPDGPLFAVVNDSSGIPPLNFPNTWIEEKNYTNNVGQYNYLRLKATTTAIAGLIEPGDTLLLQANASPGIIKSYTWSPDYNLSCTVCKTPEMIADTTTTKRVIAENNYGCRDTAYLKITIPPSDDFIIKIDDAECAANDSMYVQFTIQNLFRRGNLPNGLTIRFYDRDPRQTGASELLPPFALTQNYSIRTQTFSTFIQNSNTGKVYAVINDSGTTKPLVLPNGDRLEKEYGNNVAERNYAPEKVLVTPQDTTIFRGDNFRALMLTTELNPASTKWQTGPGYTLSCTNCPNPLITATQATSIPIETANKYGCILKGALNIKIFPPDFTMRIIQTECMTNFTTRVSFTICMNNGYDTVWKDIPVTFYEGIHGQGSPRKLNTVFVTPTLQAGACATYQHIITSPSKNQLFAVVNDKGDPASTAFDAAFVETDYTNNVVIASNYRRFKVFIDPNDTTAERASSIQLFTSTEGGNLQSVRWQPSPFLSCTDCFNPVVTPAHTDKYMVTATNEHQCTDTAWATIRTVTIGEIWVPSAFTPNADRLNDIFYVMGNENVQVLKDLIVYSRWGDIVFEAHNIPPNDPIYGWDGLSKGVKAVSGAYVYQVQAIFNDGKIKSYKGTVTLIR